MSVSSAGKRFRISSFSFLRRSLFRNLLHWYGCCSSGYSPGRQSTRQKIMPSSSCCIAIACTFTPSVSLTLIISPTLKVSTSDLIILLLSLCFPPLPVRLTVFSFDTRFQTSCCFPHLWKYSFTLSARTEQSALPSNV